MRVVVSRVAVLSRNPSNRRPITTHYYAVAEDGRQFDNRSLVTLKQVVRRRYAEVQIVEDWKSNA
jgi:hypothetical protein